MIQCSEQGCEKWLHYYCTNLPEYILTREQVNSLQNQLAPVNSLPDDHLASPTRSPLPSRSTNSLHNLNQLAPGQRRVTKLPSNLWTIKLFLNVFLLFYIYQLPLIGLLSNSFKIKMLTHFHNCMYHHVSTSGVWVIDLISANLLLYAENCGIILKRKQ